MGMEAKPTVSLHEGELRQTWIHGIYENEYVKRRGEVEVQEALLQPCVPHALRRGVAKVPVIGQNGPDKTTKPDAPPTAYSPNPSGSPRPFLVQASHHRQVRSASADPGAKAAAPSVEEEKLMNLDELERKLTTWRTFKP